jgi:hypothetical protein
MVCIGAGINAVPLPELLKPIQSATRVKPMLAPTSIWVIECLRASILKCCMSVQLKVFMNPPAALLPTAASTVCRQRATLPRTSLCGRNLKKKSLGNPTLAVRVYRAWIDASEFGLK